MIDLMCFFILSSSYIELKTDYRYLNVKIDTRITLKNFGINNNIFLSFDNKVIFVIIKEIRMGRQMCVLEVLLKGLAVINKNHPIMS